MADKDPEGPSLELPSLGFGRKKRGSKKADAEVPVDPPVEQPADEPTDEPTEVIAADTSVTPTPTPPEPEAPPLFADEAPTQVAPPVAADPEPEPEVTGGERKAPKAKREFSLPDIGGRNAALVTGLLVGVLAVGLTWGGFRLCEVVQGTSSCGNPGFFLLLAILIAMVVLGSTLLRAWAVPDPGSTSFLAIGLVAVIALLFLVDVLFSWWMIIAIPIVSMGAYALSHWVTTAFIEPADD